MIDDRPHHPATRHDHVRHKPPCTRAGLAVYAAVALVVPLTLFALSHPAVVAAAAVGAGAGLLARPLHRTLTRRDRRRTEETERPPDAVGRRATGE